MLCFLWDALRADSIDTSLGIGVLEAQDSALWAWCGFSLPVQLCTVVIDTLGFRSHTPGFGH